MQADDADMERISLAEDSASVPAIRQHGARQAASQQPSIGGEILHLKGQSSQAIRQAASIAVMD